MPTYRTLNQAQCTGKRVLVRVDHNIETDAHGKFKTDEKIVVSLPTIKFLLKNHARVILMTHVGRPEGKADPKLSTKAAAKHLQKLLPGVSITHIDQTVGPKVEKAVAKLKDGEILYLENVRFLPGEEGKPAEQKAFGKKLAALADLYVNDAFPSCHTYEEASTCAVARLLTAYMGYQTEKEVENLRKVLVDPKKPVVLIISGAKMKTKIPVIEYFLDKGNDILLGGCIANTFIAARGFDVGGSKFEESFLEKAQEIMLEGEKTKKANVHVPRDVVLATSPDEHTAKIDLPVENIEGDMSIYDVGKVTLERYKKVIEKAGTIVWNGPLGLYEVNRFSHGTKRLAEAIVAATKKGAVSIIGGGDTLDFHERYKFSLKPYTFVSTAGGAMLEFISGKKFPAIEALKMRKK